MFAQNLTDGARMLHDILQNPDGLADRITKLQEIEHRGDEMTHDIIRMLNQTFITPFDREDIHRLTSSLDDVLDFVNAAAVRMTLYRIINPPPAAADLATTDRHASGGTLQGSRRAGGKPKSSGSLRGSQPSGK